MLDLAPAGKRIDEQMDKAPTTVGRIGTLLPITSPLSQMIIDRVQHHLGGHAGAWRDDAPVPAHLPIFALPSDAEAEVLWEMLRRCDARAADVRDVVNLAAITKAFSHGSPGRLVVPYQLHATSAVPPPRTVAQARITS